MTDTDTDMIAKAEALIARLDDGTTRTKHQRRAIVWNALRSLCEPDEREHEPSEARRVWDAAYESAEQSYGGELDDNATAIIEAALVKAEERGAEREREACAGVADDEKVDAAATDDESDRIYNQACDDITAAILARGGL